MRKGITLIAAAAFAIAGCGQKTEIINLRTDYQENPVGIETEVPRFSWQMETDRYGARQESYRIVAAATENDLKSGNYLWDSGETLSDISVSIPYGGPMQPRTKYWWKVEVRDEQGSTHESAPAFFETGLMGEDWSGAEWIGSDKLILNPYRIDFIIDYDVEILDDEATFIYSAKDEDNYFAATLNRNGTFTLSRSIDGEVSKIFDCPVKLDPTAKKHHVKLDVYSNRGEKIELRPYVDGKAVDNPKAKASVNLPAIFDPSMLNEAELALISQYLGGGATDFFEVPFSESVHDSPRLYNIGYKQAENQRAVFSNIAIGERQFKETFTKDATVHEVAGGASKLWNPCNASAPMLRKEFTVKPGLKAARIYASARGIYDLELNGKLVGEDYFNPGWPDFSERNFYNTFDVTESLKVGENAIGAVLGAGWWNDAVGMSVDPYGLAQSLIVKMVLTYKDGTEENIITDGSWKVFDDGPVIANGMQTGEDYDARREIDGWSAAGFDDSSWNNVKIHEPYEGVLQAYVGETVRLARTLEAVAVTNPEPGVFIYDMGKNMVGIPDITGLKGSEGQTVRFRYAEMLWPEIIPETPVEPYTKEQYEEMAGKMYLDNYRVALSEDRYIMKGDPEGESFCPRFTQHGYRYIEITGLDSPLPLKNVKGLVLNSIGEQLSWYETDNDLVNRLFENIIWGQMGNFVSIPTDCPQRDERMGWTGDTQIFSRSATYNNMTDGFYNRWMYSLRDSQGENGSYPNTSPSFEKGGDAMGWMEAGIIVPYQVWQQYGDTRILEDHYESMSKYMDFLETRAENFIQKGGFFGDWLGIAVTNTRLTNTAYYAYDAILMTRIAEVLGKTEDVKKYSKLYDDIKEAWNKAFVDEEGYTQAVSDGLERAQAGVTGVPAPDMPADPTKPYRVNTQSSYAVPLQADLFYDSELAVKRLAEAVENNGNVLNTGFIGTPYLCLALSDGGRDDLAYKLFEQTEYPSWLFPVLQGATTMWERWNSYTIKSGFGPVSMNSFNHYSYGAVEEWMMSHSLGIERDVKNPGYKHIILQPKFGGHFGFISGGFESIYGKIEAGWERDGDVIRYSVTVPANTYASIVLPEGARITKGAEHATVENGEATLPAGKYVIEYNNHLNK